MITVSEGGLREAKKAHNRAAILEAARRVFIEIGYEACTIRDIVRESGLSPGTFYNYFDAREEVMRALVGELAAQVRTRIAAARAQARSPESFIRDAYLAYFQVIAADPENLRMVARNQSIFRVFVFEGGDVQAMANELSRDLDLAIRNRLFPPFSVDLATAALIGAGFELMVQMSANAAITPQRAADFLSRLFVSGLSGHEPRL